MLEDFGGNERVSSFAIDPSDTNRIYAGGAYWDTIASESKLAMYKSTDGGDTWTKYDLTPPIHDYGYIYSIAIDPQCPDTVYAGGYYKYASTYYGALFRSVNGGDQWSNLSPDLPDSVFNYVYDLEVNPHNDSIVYAAANKGIFKSTDWGLGWTEKGSFSSMYAVTVSSNNSEWVFSGGYYGAYYSTDGGNSWENVTQELSCPYVTSLEFYPPDSDTIHIGTYGSSLYRSAECTEVEDEKEVLIPKRISLSQNYPNPFNPTTIIRFYIGGRTSIPTTLTIYNILGRKVRTLLDEPQKPGRHEVVWDGKDDHGQDLASGIYFYRIKVGNFVQAKKMLLLK